MLTCGTITLSKLEVFNAAIFSAKVNTLDFTFNFPHSEGQILVDTMPTHIKVQELNIARLTLHEDHQVWLFNLGTIENPHMGKLNVTLVELATNTKTLFRKYKDIFAWNYIDLKTIPPQIVQHRIKLKTIIPHIHQATYGMNPTYVEMIK